jgi:hypothetical protein
MERWLWSGKDWEGCGNDMFQSLGETEINPENSVRIAGIQVKIETVHLPNRNLESYCFTWSSRDSQSKGKNKGVYGQWKFSSTHY